MTAAEVNHAIQCWIMAGCAVALAAILLAVAAVCVRRAIARGTRTGLAAFALGALVCTFAAQKRPSASVSYPATGDARYLVDAGSSVEADAVRVDFTRIVVPDSAGLYVDRAPLPEDADGWEPEWETVYSSTFAETALPLVIPCEGATNWTWCVYTDWTPGPTVQTNGVWHANWGRSPDERFIIPVRTAIVETAKPKAGRSATKED